MKLTHQIALALSASALLLGCGQPTAQGVTAPVLSAAPVAALGHNAPVTFSTSEFVTIPGGGAAVPVSIDINGTGPSPSMVLTNSSEYRIETVIWRGTSPVTLGYTGGPGGQSTTMQMAGTIRLEPGDVLTGLGAIMRTAHGSAIPIVELLLQTDGLAGPAAEGYLFVSGTVR